MTPERSFAVGAVAVLAVVDIVAFRACGADNQGAIVQGLASTALTFLIAASAWHLGYDAGRRREQQPPRE